MFNFDMLIVLIIISGFCHLVAFYDITNTDFKYESLKSKEIKPNLLEEVPSYDIFV